MAKGKELIKSGITGNLTGKCRVAYRKNHLDEAFQYIRQSAGEPKDFLGGPVFGWISVQIAIERAFRAGYETVR